jgi:soluble lytic murein transglycosylase
MIEEVEVEIIAEEPLALPQRAARSSEYLLPATTEVTPSGAFEILTPRLQAGTMRAIAQAGLLLAFCVATIGFSFHLRKMHHRQQLKVTQLQHHIQQLVVTARVDSVRRQSIEKVVTIMDRFNPQMPTDLKYRLASEIYEMSRKYRQLDVELICATITHETGHTWNPQAVSPAGAMGLMQILPSTGITLAQEEGIPWTSAEKILFDPIHNLRLGCRYLSMLVEAYTLDGGLAAYNGGMRNAELWMRKGRAKGILPAETASYVPSVLRIYKEYRRMSM